MQPSAVPACAISCTVRPSPLALPSTTSLSFPFECMLPLADPFKPSLVAQSCFLPTIRQPFVCEVEIAAERAKLSPPTSADLSPTFLRPRRRTSCAELQPTSLRSSPTNSRHRRHSLSQIGIEQKMMPTSLTKKPDDPYPASVSSATLQVCSVRGSCRASVLMVIRAMWSDVM